MRTREGVLIELDEQKDPLILSDAAHCFELQNKSIDSLPDHIVLPSHRSNEFTHYVQSAHTRQPARG